jgi:hypothetical protein
MKISTKLLFGIILISAFSFSCRKNKDVVAIQNAKCPLMAVDGPTGNLRKFEWVGAKLIRIYSKDSIPTIVVFKYNNKNLAESMEITTENSVEKYNIKFTYNDKNIVTKSNVSLNGFPFMTNEFLYNEINNLASIKTTVEIFGRKVSGKTRIEYANKNVSKVYSAIDGELETLAYVGEKYDDKLQYLPEAYRTAALGFVGISNSFFSYFGENNMTKGKFYNESGRVDQETTIAYIYDNKGLPKQSESISLKGGRKKVEVCSYSFGCK